MPRERIWIDGRMPSYTGAGISRYVTALIQALVERHADRLGVLLAARAPTLLSSTLPAEVARRVVYTPAHHRLERWTLGWEASRARPLLLHLVDHVALYLCPCPQVVTVHDVAFWRLPETHSPASRRYYAGAAMTLPKARVVVCVSDFSRRELLSYLPLLEKRVVIIPNGIEERFQPRPDPLYLYHRFGIIHPYVLVVGTVERRKQPDLVVEAFARLRRPILDLVFAGADGLGAEDVWRRAAEGGLIPRVHRLGRVSDDDLVTLYSTAEMLVFPSAYEGFAFPPLEAMACGTPVVAVEEGPLSEICGVGDEAAAVLTAADPVALAAAMERVLEEETLRLRLREVGRRRARHFTWRATAEQTWQVYERVLAGDL